MSEIQILKIIFSFLFINSIRSKRKQEAAPISATKENEVKILSNRKS